MLKFLKSRIPIRFILMGILFLAIFLRLYGINWDQNQHLHPDERFLTMTVDSMVWPSSFSEYLNPSLSKLNPYNVGAGFFVYGTLPTTMAKYFSPFTLFSLYQYNNITLTGRLLSAISDVGVVFLVFLIATNIFNKNVGLFAAFLYTISVLSIQLAHFFAVDTFINLFLVLSFYFIIKLISEKKYYYTILLGVSYGAALASKISALYFLPVIVFVYFILLIKSKNLLHTTFYFLLTAAVTIYSFRIFDPHVFSGNLIFPHISQQFIQNIKDLTLMGTKDSLFPPAIQWLKITPIIFPLKNLVLWGLGLPLGIISVVAVFYNIYTLLKDLLKRKNFRSLITFINNLTVEQYKNSLMLFWVLFLFFYQAVQFIPSMRYFLPIYPFLAILSANFLYQCINSLERKIKTRNLLTLFYSSALLLLLIWPISFLSIYSRPHSRVLASEWIYQNVPTGATLSCDLWDDCLPLNIEGVGSMGQYKILTMEPFAIDTPEKQSTFNEELQQIDYLVLSSNRAWGSLTKVPDKFPFMSKFYEDVFAGRLNFTKVAEITSYPTIPILNISTPDQLSEEAFTVYDHPKIIIFKRISNEKRLY
jgi:hypothetical protein